MKIILLILLVFQTPTIENLELTSVEDRTASCKNCIDVHFRVNKAGIYKEWQTIILNKKVIIILPDMFLEKGSYTIITRLKDTINLRQ